MLHPILHSMPRVERDICNCLDFISRQPRGKPEDRAVDIRRAIAKVRQYPDDNRIEVWTPRTRIGLRRCKAAQFVIVYTYLPPKNPSLPGVVSIRAVRHSRVENIFSGVKERNVAPTSPPNELSYDARPPVAQTGLTDVVSRVTLTIDQQSLHSRLSGYRAQGEAMGPVMIDQEFKDKGYRDAFVEANIRNAIAFQIRALRKKRRWSQGDLAARSGTAQNVISRLEDPDYGRCTLQTLLALAGTFDVALSVSFVAYKELLSQLKNVSDDALAVPSFDDETNAVDGLETTSIYHAIAPRFAGTLEAAVAQSSRSPRRSCVGALTSLASVENDYNALSDETAFSPLPHDDRNIAHRRRCSARGV